MGDNARSGRPCNPAVHAAAAIVCWAAMAGALWAQGPDGDLDAPDIGPLRVVHQEPAVRTLEVHGHMGARASFTGNSWPAFEHALRVGADVLELDVAVTRDDRVVITHDLHLNPDLCLTPDGGRIREDIPIRGLGLAELQRFDCGTLQHPSFPGQRPVAEGSILTLEGLLQRLRASRLPNAESIRFSIELKADPLRSGLSPSPERFAALVLEVLGREQALERVTIQSFDARLLKAVRKLEPALRISLLRGWPITCLTAWRARRLKADIVSPKVRWAGRGAVAALHKRGLRVIAWTPNTPMDWDKLIEAGVDGMITDDPQGLIEHLQRRGLR